MKTFAFDKFDYTDDDIIIPSDTIFYRGVPDGVPLKRSVILRKQPLYLAPKNIAKHYGPHILAFKTTRQLRLIDIRKLRNLLRLIISSRNPKVDAEAQKAIFYLTVSFGLCSYGRQVSLLHDFITKNSHSIPDETLTTVKKQLQYMQETAHDLPTKTSLNPLEPEGVRIAETYIDGHVMVILKQMLGKVYDGLIAPKMFSPFHVGNMTHEEIIIFDPDDAGIDISSKPHTQTGTLQADILSKNYDKITISYHASMMRNMFVAATGGSNVVYKDRNAFFEDPSFASHLSGAKRLAKKAQSSMRLNIPDFSKPNLKMSTMSLLP